MRDVVIFPARLQDKMGFVQERQERNDGKAINVSPMFVCPKLPEEIVVDVSMNGLAHTLNILAAQGTTDVESPYATIIGPKSTIERRIAKGHRIE